MKALIITRGNEARIKGVSKLSSADVRATDLSGRTHVYLQDLLPKVKQEFMMFIIFIEDINL